MKKFFSDFKAFITRGNIMDLAVGVVIGGAFSSIVTSLVNDIISPLIGIITGGVSLSNLKVVFTPAQTDALGNVVAEENALLYGSFLQSVIDFLIIAFSIFLVLRIIMTLRKKFEEITKKQEEESAPAPEAPDPAQRTNELLEEILQKLSK